MLRGLRRHRERMARILLFNRVMKFWFLMAVWMSTPLLHARLGDTREQAEARYGLPKSEKPQTIGGPLLEGARELTFHYEGFRIRCALLMAKDGREYVVREEYMRNGGIPTIQEIEFEAILEGESAGQTWTPYRQPISFSDGPTKILQKQMTQHLLGKVMVRSDGALACHGLGGFPVRLELPHAAKYELELKSIKEREARRAVPRF
jgi:hypothetical protein